MTVVRQPLTLRGHTHRRLEERLALRFPRALALLVGSVLRLPPRSWLRQAFVRRAAQLGFEALNRGDVEPAFALYHPDVELNLPKEFVGLGLDPPERGREERVRFERKWNAEWGTLGYELDEVIDLGDDRVMVVGRFAGSGPSSGAGFDNEFAEIFTFSAGRVIREEAFVDHAEALDAAGLCGSRGTTASAKNGRFANMRQTPARGDEP
jgi:ketosteroid isomerase-like protein